MNYNFNLTMTRDEISSTFSNNVEYIIEKQVPEDVLRWVLQRENRYLADDEIFVQYPDWKGYYISNYGNLISTKGKEPKFIKQLPFTKRYKGYVLYDPNPNKEPFPLTVGRMVAEVFCLNFFREKERDYLDVHHIDHDPENNCWKNLVLLPDPLHDEVHRMDKQHGIMQPFEVCVSPTKDGNLYPDGMKQ